MKQEEMDKIKKDVLSGKIPSKTQDSEAILSCGRVNVSLIRTGRPLTKLFHTFLGQFVQASNTACLQHNVRKPAETVDIVQELQHNFLLSMNKFAEANYLIVFTTDSVQFFDSNKD